jgi:hypothetical protein
LGDATRQAAADAQMPGKAPGFAPSTPGKCRVSSEFHFASQHGQTRGQRSTCSQHLVIL